MMCNLSATATPPQCVHTCWQVLPSAYTSQCEQQQTAITASHSCYASYSVESINIFDMLLPEWAIQRILHESSNHH